MWPGLIPARWVFPSIRTDFILFLLTFILLISRSRSPVLSGTCSRRAPSPILVPKRRSALMRTKGHSVKTDTLFVRRHNSLDRKLRIYSPLWRRSLLNVTPVSIALSHRKDKPNFFVLATDNPLVDGQTGSVHHGGNFQAMSVTNAMEKTRVAIHHIGKLLFAQCTELLNPTMNRGLPPSLAATDPSLNYHAKGLDIAAAAYVGELGYLANPVSTHVQSAEMHNQAVK